MMIPTVKNYELGLRGRACQAQEQSHSISLDPDLENELTYPLGMTMTRRFT